MRVLLLVIPFLIPAVLTALIIEATFLLGAKPMKTFGLGLGTGFACTAVFYACSRFGGISGEAGIMAPMMALMVAPVIIVGGGFGGLLYHGRGCSLFSREESQLG